MPRVLILRRRTSIRTARLADRPPRVASKVAWRASSSSAGGPSPVGIDSVHAEVRGWTRPSSTPSTSAPSRWSRSRSCTPTSAPIRRSPRRSTRRWPRPRGSDEPHLARILDWGSDRWNQHESRFVTVEQLGGGSLRDVLDRGRTLTPSQTLSVGLDVLRALDVVHRAGLVHGDVRPSTIVFDDAGVPRLIDVGLGQLLGRCCGPTRCTSATTGRCTSPRRSPTEQSIVPKSDVYSLCLTMLECVTGRVPFVGDSTVATLNNRMNKLLPVSADLGPLAAVLERAGRPDPEGRSSVGEFGQALVRTAERLPRPTPIPVFGTGLFDLDEAEATRQLRRPATGSGDAAGGRRGAAAGRPPPWLRVARPPLSPAARPPAGGHAPGAAAAASAADAPTVTPTDDVTDVADATTPEQAAEPASDAHAAVAATAEDGPAEHDRRHDDRRRRRPTPTRRPTTDARRPTPRRPTPRRPTPRRPTSPTSRPSPTRSWPTSWPPGRRPWTARARSTAPPTRRARPPTPPGSPHRRDRRPRPSRRRPSRCRRTIRPSWRSPSTRRTSPRPRPSRCPSSRRSRRRRPPPRSCRPWPAPRIAPARPCSTTSRSPTNPVAAGGAASCGG